MIYLVFYDITNDRLRKKVSDTLIAHGYERLQYSVFIGLENPKRIKGLWGRLKALMKKTDAPDDKLLFFGTEKRALEKMKVLGDFNADIDYLAGKKNAMIIQGEE